MIDGDYGVSSRSVKLYSKFHCEAVVLHQDKREKDKMYMKHKKTHLDNHTQKHTCAEKDV